MGKRKQKMYCLQKGLPRFEITDKSLSTTKDVKKEL